VPCHENPAIAHQDFPATGKDVHIRWGELCQVKDGRINEVFTLLDIVDLMQQAGLRVLPLARGAE